MTTRLEEIRKRLEDDKMWTSDPYYLLQRVEKLEGALERIASEQTPCLHCGKVHKWRPNIPEGFLGTWASEEDEHTYYRKDAKHVAQDALKDDGGGGDA